jgi:hypothetical protein
MNFNLMTSDILMALSGGPKKETLSSRTWKIQNNSENIPIDG